MSFIDTLLGRRSRKELVVIIQNQRKTINQLEANNHTLEQSFRDLREQSAQNVEKQVQYIKQSIEKQLGSTAYAEVYKAKGGWRTRIKGNNNEIMFPSGQAVANRKDAEQSVKRVNPYITIKEGRGAKGGQ